MRGVCHDGVAGRTLTFSYGRALQDEALDLWHGRVENVEAGQHAFRRRAWCESAAALGLYRSAMGGMEDAGLPI